MLVRGGGRDTSGKLAGSICAAAWSTRLLTVRYIDRVFAMWR